MVELPLLIYQYKGVRSWNLTHFVHHKFLHLPRHILFGKCIRPWLPLGLNIFLYPMKWPNSSRCLQYLGKIIFHVMSVFDKEWAKNFLGKHGDAQVLLIVACIHCTLLNLDILPIMFNCSFTTKYISAYVNCFLKFGYIMVVLYIGFGGFLPKNST